MKTLLIATLAALLFCGSIGCTATGGVPDPTVQLTQAEDVYATSEELLTAAAQQGLIPDKDKPTIAAVVHTARAVLATAQANVNSNPSQFQAAMAQFNTLAVQLITYRTQYGLKPKGT